MGGRITLDLYGALIWICFGSIGLLGLLAVHGTVSELWLSTGIAIAMGFVLFLVSARINKNSMIIMFVLLDEYRRKILELLEREMDIDELAHALSITGGTERARLAKNLDYLKKKKFIKVSNQLGKKKFRRGF